MSSRSKFLNPQLSLLCHWPFAVEYSPLLLGFLLVTTSNWRHLIDLLGIATVHLLPVAVLSTSRFSTHRNRLVIAGAVAIIGIVFLAILQPEPSFGAFWLTVPASVATVFFPHPTSAATFQQHLTGILLLVVRMCLLPLVGVVAGHEVPGNDVWLLGLTVGTLLSGYIVFVRRSLFFTAGWSRYHSAVVDGKEVPRPGKFTRLYGLLITLGPTLLAVGVALGRAPFHFAPIIFSTMYAAKLVNAYFDQQKIDESVERSTGMLLTATVLGLFLVVGLIRFAL